MIFVVAISQLQVFYFQVVLQYRVRAEIVLKIPVWEHAIDCVKNPSAGAGQ
jgi:hypothetical protein